MRTTTKNRTLAKTIAVSVGLLTAAGTATGIALAEPPNAQFLGDPPLVTADLDKPVRVDSDRVRFRTDGPTDVRVQRVTIGAGGNSGWHHHPGMVLVAVQSGTVTVTDATCKKRDYGPGEKAGSAFVEHGDAPARVTSAGGAVVFATFVAPNGKPFRVDDAPVNCPL